MFPRVAVLTGFDLYRDGGSISASFKDENSTEYCLFFGIDLITKGNREFECRGYKSPVLEIYVRNDYTSPVTGVTSKGWKKETNPISWNDSAQIIEQIKPLLEGFESDYTHVFEEMKIASEKYIALKNS